MSLPRFSVRNPVAVNLLMVSVLVLGAVSWNSLVREFFPAMEPEQLLVTVLYPGATPEEVERGVTRVVEREIEGLEGIQEIRSRAFEGITLLQVELTETADRDRLLADMRGRIDRVKSKLPDGAEEPELVEGRPYIPAIGVVVHGATTERRLREIVDDVRDDLLALESISEVVVTGTRQREYHIEVLPERLEEHGLTLTDVGRAIQRNNRDLPGGQLEGRLSNVRVRTLGEREHATALESIVVRGTPEGARLCVGDLGRASETYEDRIEKGRFEGNLAASIMVFKTPEEDAIQIAEDVRAYLKKDPTRLGGKVKLSVTTDLSRLIRQRLELMTRNAGYGLGLVLLTLALFLELRVALWVAVGLSVSFMGTFLLMLLTGQSINLISLFGLIVVLGLIVDDAIVIGENIFRRQREGIPPLEAAIKGAEEVTLPVIAAVMTTIFAFLPLGFMPGRIGSFLGVIPVVVAFALLVSLVEGFLVLPCHLTHKPKPPRWKWQRALGRLHAFRHRVFEEWLPRALGVFVAFLVRWRYASLAGAMALLMVAIGMIQSGMVPFTLLGRNDAETITVKLEMAAGTPEATTWETLGKLETLYRSVPEVDTVFAVLGASFTDRGRETPSDPAVVGQLTMELHAAERREAEGLRTSPEVVSDLRERTQSFAGVRRLTYRSQSGGPGGADLEIRLRGDDLATLEAASLHVQEQMRSFDGVEEIDDDSERGKLEARLRVRDDAALVGLDTATVGMQVRHALFGMEVQDLQIGDEEITVRVLHPAHRRESLADLQALDAVTADGRRVPFSEAIDLSTERGFASILRVDGKRTLTVTAQVNEETGANIAQITKELATERLADLEQRFPGVSHTFEGQQKQTRESVGSLRYLFPIALGLIFVIIAVLFRSYIQPIVVMSVIPFAMVGAVAGHAIMGYPLTILSMIGIVALAGIVVNDGLILVDLANRLRREGMDVLDAVVEASKGRMRAILLTSITTCVGLAPLMLETSFQAKFLIPMAVSLVFGLAFGTVLVLGLLPCVYVMLEDLRAGLRWLISGRWHRDPPYDPATEI